MNRRRDNFARYYPISIVFDFVLNYWQSKTFTSKQSRASAIPAACYILARPIPGSAIPRVRHPSPRLANSVLVDVDMAFSGSRSSPGSPNYTLGEEDSFPGTWKPLLRHFSAHHAVLFQFVRNCCRCIQLCCRPIWFLFGLIAIIFGAIIFLLIKF